MMALMTVKIISKLDNKVKEIICYVSEITIKSNVFVVFTQYKGRVCAERFAKSSYTFEIEGL